MLLRHATLARNLPSIRRRGLLTSKSQGRKKVVWLHAASKSEWATLHTIERHGGRVENVVIIEIDVPRSWLRRSRRGLRYSTRDIPATRIRRVIGFAELAGPVAA
jgi:RNA:NAD 2'-phosphotransferase (TPT1/KptA family)